MTAISAFLSFLGTLLGQKIGWRKMAVLGGLALVGVVLYLGVSTNWGF
jgi:hypothetical protein